jgi:hypothetical protein
MTGRGGPTSVDPALCAFLFGEGWASYARSAPDE